MEKAVPDLSIFAPLSKSENATENQYRQNRSTIGYKIVYWNAICFCYHETFRSMK